VEGVVNCGAYHEGKRVADVPLEAIAAALAEPGRFVWIGLREPDADVLALVQDQFGLHELAVEDARRAHQRPKLERYGDSIFVVLRTAQFDTDGHVEFGETHIFVGEHYVVSIRHGSSLSYADVRARCESTPSRLAKGPGFVLYALMDFIVDQYFPIVETLEDTLESLEDQIFGERFGRDTTQQIYLLKRDLLELKRAVLPLIDICNRLMRFEVELIPEETRLYFRDVYDHAIRINEMVDTQRELLTTALEANLSLISVAQNESMKRLTAWAAIIAIPTMIAGIYGMNFKFMPELESPWGYPIVMTVMIVACALLYLNFKRIDWL
jgi:magnesium transporter